MFAGFGDVGRSLGRQSKLVAAACLVADVAPLLLNASRAPVPPAHWFVVVAVVLADLALAAPDRFSGHVAVLHAVVSVGCAIVLTGLVPGSDGETNDAGSLIAAYRAGAWLRGGPAALALTALVAGAIVTRAVGGFDHWTSLPLHALTSAGLPWLVGSYTTARRGQLAELEQRADNQQREAEAAIATAVSNERGAIARDLHDVISHHVSAIGVHAGAAKLGLGNPSREALLTRALDEVENSSHAAMSDLRRMLDLLHGNDSDSARQPGLDNLEELVDGVRAAGMAVRMDVIGVRPAGLPGSLDIALYRIAQEVLTNALRHGDGTAVELRIEHKEDVVVLSSENPVPPHRVPTPGGHRGLAGIRQRAAMFDGDVSYGQDPHGRSWHISVVVPVVAS